MNEEIKMETFKSLRRSKGVSLHFFISNDWFNRGIHSSLIKVVPLRKSQ